MRLYDKKSGRLLMSILLFLLLSISARGQQAIGYDYDANGNRTNKHIITLKSWTGPQDETELKKEIQEEQLGEMTLQIYPNPTKGEVIVEITGADLEPKVGYYLYSPTGKLLENKKDESGRFSVNLSNFPSGMYIIKVNVSGKVSEWKISKQ